MPGWNPSRLTEWRPQGAALKFAVRAAIFMPLSFALATVLVDGEHGPVFAGFGSFALLVLVEFTGRPRSRLAAYLALAAVGAAFITIATLCSQSVVAATALAGLLTFAITYSGVINGYLAAARTAAILLVVLPVMVPADAAAIPERLLGWGIACLVCIPAILLLWKTPWAAQLAKGCARTCRSMAELLRNPDSDELRDRATADLKAVRTRYLATPHRPTGPTGRPAAIAALIDELGWMLGTFWQPGPSLLGAPGSGAERVREAGARVLEDSSDALLGHGGLVATTELDERRTMLVPEFTRKLAGDREAKASLKDDLTRTFRLRMLGFSVAEVAAFSNVAVGSRQGRGVLGVAWMRIFKHGRRSVSAAENLLVEHADLRSAWLRTSLRAAAGIALAVFVADLANAQNAFWVVLGTLSVLKSNASGTRGSVFSSLVGTAVGIMIGAVAVVLIGEREAVLWVALPVAVLFAAYAGRAISFGASQAGFSMLVMILFNLIDPVGAEIGLVRAQDVALGCLVSLAVGLLLWPHGARELIKRTLADAYETSIDLVASRTRQAIEGETIEHDSPDRLAATAATDRLEMALRQHLEETTAGEVESGSLVALAASASRLRRAGHSLRTMSLLPWYAPVPKELIDGLLDMDESVRRWYSDLGRSLDRGGEVPPPEPLEAPFAGRLLELIAESDDPDSMHGALTAAWLTQALEYLSLLESRVAELADGLFAVTEAELRDGQVG